MNRRVSLLQDALKKASLVHKGREVFQVPTVGSRRNALPAVGYAVLLAILVALAAAGVTFRNDFVKKQNELSGQLEQARHEYADLKSRLYNDDDFLDSRIQLDFFDLRAEVKKMTDRMGEIGIAEAAFKSESQSLREEMFFINKRLHQVERNQSELAERAGVGAEAPEASS